MVSGGMKVQSIYFGIQSISEDTDDIKHCIVKNFSILGGT